MKIYKLKTFSDFMKSMENGHIKIKFKIGIFKTGSRIGELHNHGASFEIDQNYFEDLYECIGTFY